MFFLRECFAQEVEGLRGIKPPVEFPGNYFFLFLILFLALLIAGFFLFRYFYGRRKMKPKAVESAKPPYLIAYERLEVLRNKNLPGSGEIQQYYVELSDIVRRYLEGQFLIKAPEMTTDEFLHAVNQAPALVFSKKNLLYEFLGSCDMVKFAKYGPEISEMDNSFLLAKKLIDETRQTDDGI
ncbi:MAG: hypothetical protein PHY73_06660 [Candidatus Omnitrophica bacterium]|nr:hypothetical protein [Candidatus Omnitrophota bacterium]